MPALKWPGMLQTKRYVPGCERSTVRVCVFPGSMLSPSLTRVMPGPSSMMLPFLSTGKAEGARSLLKTSSSCWMVPKPLEEVSRYLGHSSTMTTRRYAQLTTESLGVRAAAALSQAGLVAG